MVLETKEMSIAAVSENCDVVVDFIESIMSTIEATMSVKNQIITAVEELYGNVAKYAYADDTGYITIRCMLKDKKRLIIQFADSGKPFNPLEYGEPDIKASLRERKIGGLGIYIVKKSVDKLLYHHKEGKNIVTIVKRIA